MTVGSRGLMSYIIKAEAGAPYSEVLAEPIGRRTWARFISSTASPEELQSQFKGVGLRRQLLRHDQRLRSQ
ncbi:MAG: hypothetical protein ACRDHB_09725, partial [Actinomycetota bacterium]